MASKPGFSSPEIYLLALLAHETKCVATSPQRRGLSECRGAPCIVIATPAPEDGLPNPSGLKAFQEGLHFAGRHRDPRGRSAVGRLVNIVGVFHRC